MRHFFFSILFSICYGVASQAQSRFITSSNSNSATDSNTASERKFSTKKDKIKRAPIAWYKIISHEKDTTYLDTTLSLKKDFKFNYLRKDNFDLISHVNVGKTYLELSKQIEPFRAFPKFGATSRQFGFFHKEDINYYQVPTPLSDLYFKTTLEQGQQLDAFLTVNTSPNLNFSIAYKGVRSLGIYRDELTSTRAFRGTLSYQLPSKRYVANFHFVDQTFENEENGGLSATGVSNFLSRRADFDRRAVLEVNLNNTDSELESKRLHLDHEYRILKSDSVQKNQLAIAHIFTDDVQEFRFNQSNATPSFFGDSQRTGSIANKNELNYIQNSLGLRYQNPYLGKLEAMFKHSFFDYSYNSLIIIDNEIIPNIISDNIYGITAKYTNKFKGFKIKGDVESNFIGGFKNQKINGNAYYTYKDEIYLNLGYSLISETPEINKLLNQSSYINYNWFNDFSNTITNTLQASVRSKRFLDAEFSLSTIKDYTYFSLVTDSNNSNSETFILNTRPFQNSNNIQLFKLKLNKTFRWRNFGLTNTLLYQEVNGNENNLVYNVPTFVTRNTLFYQNDFFKNNALFMQFGATFRYYTSYFADGYDPLLGESFTQNQQKFGNTPLLDIFLNAKVRQTRIFLKLENTQNIFQQNNELLTLNTPTRDFLVRFGVVWNFFL